ncbi:hypothetical protein CU097_002437 [Rhizopus azygosporus]|uniref:Uncharacterized protein n=1 Tax=Rhizopus azygosporus TaxID=86630 RepID=A0A367IT94_RHIAZ|nr:hypothetical protein CU097_002437 [Rhizopus azygosporus]
MQAVAAWFAVEKGADERIIEKDEIEIIDDEQVEPDVEEVENEEENEEEKEEEISEEKLILEGE